MKEDQQDRRRRYTDFVIRHEGLIFNLCYRYSGGNRDECADLVQEVALMLWHNFDRLTPDAQPRQETRWVQWRVRTFLFNLSRSRRVNGKSARTIPLPENPLTTTNVQNSQVATDSQSRELLLDLARRLEPGDRYLLQLRLDGYTNPEIADVMGLTPNAVSQRYRRMIKKLKTIYENEQQN
ncbi:MAG: sigma-70 family RNA polymerase sigma factor [Bacteroidales bacterium]|nr:sigma-70 family RNA polymerase sigma factor [Bacteroidales bacterium]